jgi:hypothetical protein
MQLISRARPWSLCLQRILAAQPIREISCIFRCIREMLACIEKISLIREIRG